MRNESFGVCGEVLRKVGAHGTAKDGVSGQKATARRLPPRRETPKTQLAVGGRDVKARAATVTPVGTVYPPPTVLILFQNLYASISHGAFAR
jgi:hypothetical protein